MKKISIVVPIYNEEANIEYFSNSITQVMSKLSYDWELIFVDDGSKDATPMLIHQLSLRDCRIKGFQLSRNYGHMAALSCGLDNAQGDAVISMDGDMQHPPEMLPQLLELWEQGYEVVQTLRKSTEGVSLFKKVTSAFFYKLINSMSKVQIAEGGSDFRLLDRKAVLAFRKFREESRFIRGMISALGYKKITVDFVASPRFAGKSKYSLGKMMHFALDGITAFSKTPLRLVFYFGLLCGLLSVFLIAHVFYVVYFTNSAAPGWASMTASIAFVGGIQMMGLGVIGEYIGRIFEEVKHRPIYLISEEIGEFNPLHNHNQ
ncbi:MAG: glycosyltransferase family 2 protein [Negativicutes bacterium]|jgi:dolichol-phosphate mannosyltransferase